MSPGYRVRRERFGCLIYSHAHGNLVALQSPLLAHLLSTDGTRTIVELISAATGLQTPPAELVDQVVGALNGLERRGIIREI